MVRLLAALAQARDSVDANVAFGEAVPRFTRLKTILLAGLLVATIILSGAYIQLHQKVDAVQAKVEAATANQKRGQAERAEMLSLLRQNQALVKALVGQRGANAQR